ncbi:MAG: MgtC/SapB family protein [Solirubrobacteraceae bacterium]|nr:MgtC/SapB family protein [Patulibacter sp.]
MTTHAPSVLAVADGQDPKQIAELALAFVLGSLIGLERQWRQKAAGLRTYTLVGVGSALFILVSKYGFGDVLGDDVVLDPSRVAAQVVSGIGFIGGGLIFVRGDAVRGLTTAATVWVTAAIGMASGAGLWRLAIAATVLHFVVVLVYPVVVRSLPNARDLRFRLQIRYADGRGVLRDILAESTGAGFSVARMATHHVDAGEDHPGTVSVAFDLEGGREVEGLAVRLNDLPGVVDVSIDDLSSDPD